MTPSDVIIIGAGGHGRVVLDILRSARQHNPIAFVDADPTLAGTSVGGVPVVGQINLLPKLQKKVRSGIVAIGDNRARLRYAQVLIDSGISLINAIHPAASISPTARVGSNVVVCAGAIVSTEARLGDSVIVNSNAVVEHECEIAAGAHIAPGALLAGRVRLGEGAFVGLGAKVIQCLTIGSYSTIGAGAVVIRDLPAHATAVGVPARVIKVEPA